MRAGVLAGAKRFVSSLAIGGIVLVLHPLDAHGQELIDPDLSVAVVASGFGPPRVRLDA